MGNILKLLISLVPVVLMLSILIGWFMNVFAVFKLDFQEPYKAEVVRVLGIVIPPVGGMAGYVTFEEEKEDK